MALSPHLPAQQLPRLQFDLVAWPCWTADGRLLAFELEWRGDQAFLDALQLAGINSQLIDGQIVTHIERGSLDDHNALP